MRNVLLIAGAAVTACIAALPAQAADYLSANIGYYDFIRQRATATQFGLEYRFSPVEFGIRPIVGAFVTSRNAIYGYGGFNWDVQLLPNQLYLVPNFAVGAYSNGDGRDMGGTLEFRSGLELDYQFPNAQQLGVAINHISNAGIYKRNPGEETLMATYSIPIGSIASWMGR